MKKKNPHRVERRPYETTNVHQERKVLIAAFRLIHGHALEMAGKTARVYDKTDPILRICVDSLKQLGAPMVPQ